MQTDILIIGGGLSGLTAAWQLHRAGVDVMLLEARTRFGGRAFTAETNNGADCDLGPSWFWSGQPLIASLLSHFSIPAYEQYADGTVLYQQADGQITQAPYRSPMHGSLRIEGGLNRLTSAIVGGIEPSRRFLGHVVTGLSLNNDNDGIIADVISPAGNRQIEAKQVAIAMPPRLAAELTYTPPLTPKTAQTLRSTPTWMAGHAKFFAVYDTPFWREKGLCGTAISRLGPLAEIHDASPHSGSAACLFGFAGLDATSRASMGKEAFMREATLQLAALFGDEANRPTALYFQDWSTEQFTASIADRQPQTRHPAYGLTLDLGRTWHDKLTFISSETSFSNGGLIEGALEAGVQFSQRHTKAEIAILRPDEPTISHHASMDWDWL